MRQKIDSANWDRVFTVCSKWERGGSIFPFSLQRNSAAGGLNKIKVRGPERGPAILTSPLWSPCRQCATGTYPGSPRCQSSGGGPVEEGQTGAQIPLLHVTPHPPLPRGWCSNRRKETVNIFRLSNFSYWWAITLAFYHNYMWYDNALLFVFLNTCIFINIWMFNKISQQSHVFYEKYLDSLIKFALCCIPESAYFASFSWGITCNIQWI